MANIGKRFERLGDLSKMRKLWQKRVEPIKPEDVKDVFCVPDAVIRVFNHLIRVKWDGKSALFALDEAATLIAVRMGITKAEVYDRHLLDVESLYRSVGWNVSYWEPGDTRPAAFRFTRPVDAKAG